MPLERCNFCHALAPDGVTKCPGCGIRFDSLPLQQTLQPLAADGSGRAEPEARAASRRAGANGATPRILELETEVARLERKWGGRTWLPGLLVAAALVITLGVGLSWICGYGAVIWAALLVLPPCWIVLFAVHVPRDSVQWWLARRELLELQREPGVSSSGLLPTSYDLRAIGRFVSYVGHLIGLGVVGLLIYGWWNVGGNTGAKLLGTWDEPSPYNSVTMRTTFSLDHTFRFQVRSTGPVTSVTIGDGECTGVWSLDGKILTVRVTASTLASVPPGFTDADEISEISSERRVMRNCKSGQITTATRVR